MSALLQSPSVSIPIDSPFTAWVCAEGGHHTVHARGELDLSNRCVMLRACLEGNHVSVVVDLTELRFMDCAGYGALVEAREVLDRRRGSLTLAHAVGEPALLLTLIDGLATRCRDSSGT